ncbi:zinc-dependent alcohol dehydrogenase [Bacillus infantis]|nr:alcohol dehydrogenase catalytic domain-containing protein [Bacillus infantis]
MKAIVKARQAGRIRIEEKELPQLGDGEVLVEVSYCGVCGSDIHAAKHAKGYEFVGTGTTLGHEISGKVINVSGDENAHLLNKHVVIESMHYCGSCENCREGRTSVCHEINVIGLHFDGGMAQYVKVKPKFIQELPPQLPVDMAALLEPMSIAVHSVKKIKEIMPQDNILIQGPGIIGFFTGLICSDKKAEVRISGLERDYNYRLSKAYLFNMKPFIADKEELPDKVDYVFECSGSSAALKSSFRYLRKGGQLVAVALYEQETALFLTEMVRNEWPILTSYGCDPEDYRDAADLLIKYQSQLRNIVSYFPLIEAERAFTESMNQKVLKAVLYN